MEYNKVKQVVEIFKEISDKNKAIDYPVNETNYQKKNTLLHTIFMEIGD